MFDLVVMREAEEEGGAVRPARATETLIEDRLWIDDDAELIEAVELFQSSPALRLLPVIAADGTPVGAIFEREMRTILFNPYGHALLKNPSFGGDLRHHIRACPTVESGTPVPAMLDLYTRHKGMADGLIVTKDGRFLGVIGDKLLLHLAAEREMEIARERSARLATVERSSDAFEGEAAALSAELAALSDRLAISAQETAAQADLNGERSTLVANAASQVSMSIKDIANRTGALAGTLQAVENKSGDARRATSEAVAASASSGTQMRLLSRAAAEIGEVIDLIDGIARKTAMLAINATIEAARAGEAGRGFATVASEVKSLSAQTRTAAAGVRERISNIRGAITHVSDGHQAMDRVVGGVDAMSDAILLAIQEQRAASQIIATSLEEASTATAYINQRAEEISRSSDSAARTADGLRSLAGKVADQGDTIQRRLGAFVEAVKAA